MPLAISPWTRERIAEDTVTNWELGHSRPLVRFAAKIIQFLGYHPEKGSDPSSSWVQVLIAYRRRHGPTQTQLALRFKATRARSGDRKEGT